MEVIDIIYKQKCAAPGDIFEHLPTLRDYAAKCGTVAELGVRTPVSTWAFMRGLCDSPSPVKKLFCVDIIPVDMTLEQKLSNQVGIDLEFIQDNSATVNLGANVDLLFIDTWHVYGHLKRELEHHHTNVSKYIIMHDTTIDAVNGESLRCGLDVKEQAKSSGYPLDEICKGLGYAIQEFLEAHPEWKTEKVFSNCNGLTILSRS